jgi:hypothetical protein
MIKRCCLKNIFPATIAWASLLEVEREIPPLSVLKRIAT